MLRPRLNRNICICWRCQRHLQHFGQMQGVTRRALGDLFAATEAVGYDQPIGRGVADSGEKFEFADGDRDAVLLSLEAEGAGHAAAAGSWTLEVDPNAVKKSLLGSHLHQGFLVAVSVEQCFAIETLQRKIFYPGFQKFAKQETLARQSFSALVVRK